MQCDATARLLLDASRFERLDRQRVEAYACRVDGVGTLTVMCGVGGVQAVLVWSVRGAFDLQELNELDAAALWQIARLQVSGTLPRAQA